VPDAVQWGLISYICGGQGEFETKYHYVAQACLKLTMHVAQADLELMIFLPQPLYILP
jgi:hypothetical protein